MSQTILSDAQAYKAFHRIADRLAPELRRAFLQAVEQLRGRVSLDALIDAVAKRKLERVTLLVEGFAVDLQPAVQVVNHAFASAGAKAADQLGPSLGASVRFDVVNPEAVKAAAANAARLVTEVTTTTRKAIRAVIVQSFREGIAPRDAAVLIRPLIGLTSRQALAVIHYRQRLAELGLNGQKAQERSDRYAARLLRERALSIARTETIEAATQGQLALWNQAKRDGLLTKTATKVWIVTPDDRLCPLCAALDGLEAPIGKPFRTAYGNVDGPTLHPRCRCAVGIGQP